MISQIRDVARLQTLDVTLHKKVSYQPDPQAADSAWKDVWHWAEQALLPSRGKVIVFAMAHLGLDLSQLDATSLRGEGTTVFVVLPPAQVQVELLPGETEVIGSNLDTAQSAALLESARVAFARDVSRDVRLNERARVAAEGAIRALFVGAGFTRVQFVESLPGGANN